MATSPYAGTASAARASSRQSKRSKFYLPRGSATEGRFAINITPETAGWKYSGLRVLELSPSQREALQTGPDEMLVLPLEGSCTVTVDGETFELHGRKSVFDRVTDFVYVPAQSSVEIVSAKGGRFALPSARTDRKLKARYGPAENVLVETRGAGRATRQVNNICSPETFPHADKLIAVEVLTPSGNWSSYPPHKHDEHRVEGGEVVETKLEEIYAFVLPGEEPAIQRAYSSGADRQIDVFEEVGDGDVVLIPHGWHGPSVAPPHSDFYYLNVMAGPAEGRAWKICFDADRNIMDKWASDKPDSRIPMTSAEGRCLPKES